MRRSIVVLAVLTLGFAVGCDGDAEPMAGGVVTGALSGAADAELDVVSGSDTVVVRAVDLGDQLFRASTPASARVVPSAAVDSQVVRVSLAGSGGRGGADLTVELSTQARWRIRLDGGASQQTVAMSAGHLTELDFGAGSTRIEVILPVPRGTVPVRMTGGASAFSLRLPPAVATQVRLAGGGGQASIDGVVHTGISGGSVFTSDGWSTATDRYLIDNVAGVSALTLDRTS
jgi:hypothetical protein